MQYGLFLSKWWVTICKLMISFSHQSVHTSFSVTSSREIYFQSTRRASFGKKLSALQDQWKRLCNIQEPVTHNFTWQDRSSITPYNRIIFNKNLLSNSDIKLTIFHKIESNKTRLLSYKSLFAFLITERGTTDCILDGRIV